MNLTCVVKHSPEPPPAIYWTHNEEVSNRTNNEILRAYNEDLCQNDHIDTVFPIYNFIICFWILIFLNINAKQDLSLITC